MDTNEQVLLFILGEYSLYNPLYFMGTSEKYRGKIPTPNIEMVKSKAIKKNHFDTLLLKKHCLIRA